MDLEARHLRYVVALAETLHFSRAAERLHMSQPALSARIKAIEKHLGVPLFQRTTRSVTCTDAGHRFVDHAREILRLLGDAEREARDSALGRVVPIGFYGVAAGDLTAAIIDRFRDHNPGVEIELKRHGWEDPSAGLHDRKVPLAFVRPPFHTRGLRMLTLLSEARVVGLPSSHPLAHRDTVDVTELLTDPIAVRRTPDELWSAFWSAGDLLASVPAPRLFEVRDVDEELQAVALGRAITFTTTAAQEYFPRPGVTYVPLTGLPPSPIALAWHANETDPACHAFVDAARYVLAQQRKKKRK
ncbi:LysR family transcriptional regulator [Amycolatopsis rhabdoformis]|uniref:LysR family transcriptional regulator n=1 Tax=Amycolatopsis rhabdoformis TaxID=1448059 RepID=A0ABZ1I7F2_9PSEU|nr:LysR family transcriptional regulator [Amycolatopsis rhabdoformis]WSE29901.1 LysR family transcriptional regulator [Amycolatopsis rhabdoformis]